MLAVGGFFFVFGCTCLGCSQLVALYFVISLVMKITAWKKVIFSLFDIVPI
jgi:hypothetical protein